MHIREPASMTGTWIADLLRCYAALYAPIAHHPPSLIIKTCGNVQRHPRASIQGPSGEHHQKHAITQGHVRQPAVRIAKLDLPVHRINCKPGLSVVSIQTKTNEDQASACSVAFSPQLQIVELPRDTRPHHTPQTDRQVDGDICTHTYRSIQRLDIIPNKT